MYQGTASVVPSSLQAALNDKIAFGLLAPAAVRLAYTNSETALAES